MPDPTAPPCAAGAVAARLQLYDSSLVIVASHLASGEAAGDEARRNADVADILRRADFAYAYPNTSLQAQRTCKAVGCGRGVIEMLRAAAATALHTHACQHRCQPANNCLTTKCKYVCMAAPAVHAVGHSLPHATCHCMHAGAALVGPGMWLPEQRSILEHDAMLWLGDLNYRLTMQASTRRTGGGVGWGKDGGGGVACVCVRARVRVQPPAHTGTGSQVAETAGCVCLKCHVMPCDARHTACGMWHVCADAGRGRAQAAA